jgi:hypothetical protein
MSVTDHAFAPSLPGRTNAGASVAALTARAAQDFPWLALFGFWAAVSAGLLAMDWSRLALTLGGSYGDTDSAMRLVEVRRFLAGESWFQPFESRLAPPEGYVTHWSRFVDAPIAGLVVVFRWFVSPELAERMARAVWPLMTLLPAFAGAAAIAARIAGRDAALMAIQMGAMSMVGLSIFRPGMIDHHNLQVALMLLAVAGFLWSDRWLSAGVLGGAAAGLMLAIGIEAVPYLAALCGGLCVAVLQDRRFAQAAAILLLSLGFFALLSYGLSTPEALRGTTACEAFGVNLLGGVVVGSFGAAGASLVTARFGWRAGLIGFGLSTLAAAAVFVSLDPRCVSGPFGAAGPELKALWLAHVQEMKGFSGMLAENAGKALAFAAFPVVGMLVLALVTIRTGLRDRSLLLLAATLTASILVALFQVRAVTYANWLAVPLVASGVILLARRAPRFDTARLLGLVLANPATIVLAITLTADALKPGAPANAEAMADPDACYASSSFRPLATLPPGLVLANVDLGPFILGETGHSVLMAPYRLYPEIIEGQKLFAMGADEAVTRLRQRGIAYVVECPGLVHPVADANPQSLRSRIMRNAPPAGLERLTVPGPHLIYRVTAPGARG